MKALVFPLLLFFGLMDADAQTPPPLRHAPDREFHMSNIVLNLKFDIAGKTVRGQAIETIIPLRASLDSLHLDAVGMQIGGVSIGGKAAGYRYDGRILTFALDKHYGLQDKVTFTISYSAQPSRGLFFISPDKAYPKRNPEIWSNNEPEDARYWFPCHDYPDDFTSSEIIATVPSNWTVISNGVLKSTVPSPNGRTKNYDWVESQPHVVYLISIVAGIFNSFQSSYGNIPIYYYSDPSFRNQIKQNLSAMPDILKFYSDITGQQYPWEKLALTTVTDFTWGGEENVSAITLTDRTLHDANSEPQVSSVGLIAHETAHQWFGDLLTTRNWNNIWLNEGFATYFEALYREHAYGESEFQFEMSQNHADVIKADDIERRPTVYDRYYDPVEMFGAYVYPRGASVLHMLRFVLGDDEFDKAIQHYVAEFTHSNVDTRDFSNSVREATGINVDQFFNEWLYMGGHPDFRISYQYVPTAHNLLLHVEQTQKVDSLTPVYHTPVNIYIVTPTTKETKRITIDSTSGTFSIPVPDKPLMVNFNEGHWLLDEVDFKKTIDELAYQLQNDPDVAGRIWAAHQLSGSSDQDAESYIISGLTHDSFWGVREECAKLLGNYSNEDSKNSLASATDDRDSRVATAAIRSLGRFKKDKSIERLLTHIFYSRANYFVRAAAVTSLIDVDSTKSVHVLYTALDRNSYNEVLRTAALNAMAKARPAMAYRIAMNYSKYGQPGNLRTAGIAVLAKLDQDKDQTISVLTKYLKDPYIWVRASAINALGKIGDKTVLPLLEQCVKNEPDGRLVEMARRAMETITKRKS